MPEQIIKALQLDRASSVPLALQIERDLLSLLDSGALKPGDKLPHELELCKRLNISRWTVRQAIGHLVDKGLIRRTRRAGTFVTEKSNTSRTIGFFYFREAANVLANSMNEMHRLLAEKGFDLKIIPFPYDYYDHVDLLAEVKRCELAGAILVALNRPGCRAQLLRLEAQRFPYVRLGNKCFMGQLRAPLVTGDDRRAARDGIAYLARLGHERIGFVAHRKRSEGRDEYLMACAGKSGFRERWLEQIELEQTLESWQRRSANPMLRDYLDRNPEVTAILVEHGGMAAKLLIETQASGRNVPRDLSIVSLEDWPILFSMVEPGITTMHLSRETEVALAVERLLAIVEKGSPEHEEIVQVPYELVEGGSAAEAGKGKADHEAVRAGVCHPELARDIAV